MAEVLAQDTGVTGTGSADLGCLGQQFYSGGELFFVQIVFHFSDASCLDIIGLLCLVQSFLTNHNIHSLFLLVFY